MIYFFNLTVTASAKYLKGNQTNSLIPFLFGTILALFEILADDYSSPLTVLHNICLLLY